MEKYNNRLFPFFWQHGEDEAILVDYVDKIHKSGMEAVCVESRPHPDFVGDKWWIDLGIIIRECRKRDMKLWILDDAHFPTGGVNGKVPEHLQKQYLAMRRFDVVGPFPGARIDASQLKGRPWEQGQTDIVELVGVYLAQRDFSGDQTGDPIDPRTMVDLTNQFKDDTIYLDIPVGHWSVFVVYVTRVGGEETTKNYLNPLVAEATQVLVDEVYEKHFEQVGDYFGSTITAFFSDEPRFGNEKGTASRIGKPDMVLPWRPGLADELGVEKHLLPLLWTPAGDGSHRNVRYTYMDVVTKVYNENFVKVLADWCQSHGVDYLGHNIEDNGAHARLGYGAGHFFRGQEAQHFSGIDVIGGQVVPGMNYHHDSFQTGGSDGQFFHYALAKLGASAADLYPHKQGRAMCEAFGAYGWNEGLKTMKWIADHLMVRGINYIVPHALSPKEYPDWDCPPHFYARGNNPQFRYMSYLTAYMNRIMNIFSDGKHVAPVALFYPAEFEWVGDYMPVEVPARILTQGQIDFDIVPHDLLETAEVHEGALLINGYRFETLILPYAAYIPEPILATLNRLMAKGLSVLALEALPVNSRAYQQLPEVVELSKLTERLSAIAELRLVNPMPELVYYHYQKDGKDYWMFFNESMNEVVDSRLEFFHQTGQAVAYDAYTNTYHQVIDHHLTLAPYETVIWIFGESIDTVESLVSSTDEHVLELDWTISLASATDYPNFTSLLGRSAIVPVNQLDGYNRATGTVAYQATVNLTEVDNILALDLGQAYEVAEVFINGQSLGVKVAPPYFFEVAGVFKSGQNDLRIEVTNTLGTAFRGGINQYLLVEPFGLVTSPKLLLKS